ncbi:MAG TPA: class D sortase [Bryobacteraceae bacterium]|nr:class D sortase [Bryobacteraceae bacterium]
MHRLKILLPWLLIAGGSYFIFLGAREYLIPHIAQARAKSSWNAKYTVKAPPLQPGEVFARLWIPRLRTTLYVVEGTSPQALRRGPGHLQGSAMPGSEGNCIIAGHRDTHFQALKGIHTGDKIQIRTVEGTYTYRVSGTTVVAPNNTSVLEPSSRPELHLITCYPFRYVGNAPKRFVVGADLVSHQTAPPG